MEIPDFEWGPDPLRHFSRVIRRSVVHHDYLEIAVRKILSRQ
jgi:hypothetical protein